MEETPLNTTIRIPKGINVSEPEASGPEVEKHTCATPSAEPGIDSLPAEDRASVSAGFARWADASLSWSYLFVHHSKVKSFVEAMEKDGIRHFIHKSVTYHRNKDSRGIRAVEKQTVSGLVFMQDTPQNLQNYLDRNFPGHHLVKNCSTRLPAVISDSVMQPFMRVLDMSPERVRFLLHPFKYYAGGNTKLRITSGFLAGIEGYVVRIDRDRRLVMDVGGMSVAIAGVHCEKFEVVRDEA